jgi:hypothetical protein
LDSNKGLHFDQSFSSNLDRKNFSFCEVSRIAVLKYAQKTKAVGMAIGAVSLIAKDILKKDYCLINANPETNNIYDANSLYDYIIEQGYSCSDLEVFPKNGKENYSNECLLESLILGETIKIPKMIQSYLKMNFKLIGRPNYIPKYHMCGLPMILKGKEMNPKYHNLFTRLTDNLYFPSREELLENYVKKKD